MKTKKIACIIALVAMLLIIGTNVNATVSNLPNGTVHTNITASDAYSLCYNMRSEALGNNKLDPHLTTNADWAAAAYLGASAYGSVNSAYGYSTQVTIGSKKYYSTTNNITGIMNMGVTRTMTASVIAGAPESSYRTNLENNLETRYVDVLNETVTDNSNKGKAIYETSGWFGVKDYYVRSDYPLLYRKGVLNFICGLNNYMDHNADGR